MKAAASGHKRSLILNFQGTVSCLKMGTRSASILWLLGNRFVCRSRSKGPRGIDKLTYLE